MNSCDNSRTVFSVPCLSKGGTQISLGAAQLDVEAVLVKQRILLKSIPRGTAKIVFTARDFGNFLAHPLMRKAASTAIQVGPVNHGDPLSHLLFPCHIVLSTSV